MNTITMYIINRYGNNITSMIHDRFIDQFPYMESCNMALLIPETYINRKTIPIGLISPILNEGSIIR